ncbi:MAG: RluA family pseudouridine synthase [Clostridiales bacterium]|nr:RluA family pseudouridine synthase [Clostridiales bacterium]
MQKIEFEVKENIELTKAIINELPFLSRFDVKKMLENKDIKINGARVKENIDLKKDDKVVVFYVEKESKEWYTLVYEDENVLIVNKRAGIEIVSEKERDLLSILSKENDTVLPVHRLDRNTEGLVVFAKNKMSEKELLTAFKTRQGIVKKYALLVHGRVDITKIKRTVYLKKVDALSKVWISEIKTTGYEPAVTEFDIIEYRGDNTLLEANLLTGKTHQIRAHISYYGHSILGDQKYGKDDYDKLHLTANYLAFNFKKDSKLYYLKGKNFEIIPTWI